MSIGDRQYRITASRREGRWTARAERAGGAGSGDRFGIECADASETEAIARLGRWLAWQHEHAAALGALQDAEREYHRTMTGLAFASQDEASSEMQRASLAVLDTARVRLDTVRSQNPEA